MASCSHYLFAPDLRHLSLWILSSSFFLQFRSYLTLILTLWKMDEYGSMVTHEALYYYASIILHHDHDLAWFEKHWEGYASWVKEVRTGMKSFV